MSREHERNNDASRQRLHALITSLNEEALQQKVGDGWTVAAILAHMGFWDRSIAIRWDDYARSGQFEDFSSGAIDVINAANLPTWLALPGKVAADLALRASEDVDARLRMLSDEEVAYALGLGRSFTVDRSGHRTAHLNEIEASLGR